MFYGEYDHSIDRKGRLIIPSKFREVSKEHYVERFFITRGLDTCLFVFTEDEWRKQESRFKTLSFTNSEARRFNRLYFSGACDVNCDKQGRILVPQYLKDFAHIKRDVVIVGVSNRIEIWSKENWAEFYKTTKDSFEKIAENILEAEMSRSIRKEFGSFTDSDAIENFKRRRALPPFSGMDANALTFFERLLDVKKERDVVFITKAKARQR